MRHLTQRVKDSALKKWSFRAETVEEMVDWIDSVGIRRCSFCNHFGFMKEDEWFCGICPLYGDDCCAEEFIAACSASTVPAFNTAAEALYKRIEALPVTSKRGRKGHGLSILRRCGLLCNRYEYLLSTTLL